MKPTCKRAEAAAQTFPLPGNSCWRDGPISWFPCCRNGEQVLPFNLVDLATTFERRVVVMRGVFFRGADTLFLMPPDRKKRENRVAHPSAGNSTSPCDSGNNEHNHWHPHRPNRATLQRITVAGDLQTIWRFLVLLSFFPHTESSRDASHLSNVVPAHSTWEVCPHRDVTQTTAGWTFFG